jgi:hypothetical protein
MRSLEEPDAPRGRGLWILLGLALVAAVVAWYAASRPATSPAAPERSSAETPARGTPSSGNEPPTATERPPATGTPRPSPGTGSRAAAPKSAPTPAATPARPAREFRVTSDVPGAYIFLDRKFLGTTPFSSREVAAGTYQLNVQVEGRPPVVRSVDVTAEGITDIAVTIPAARTPEAAASLSEEVAVVHQHAVGSCEGTLRASGDGLRYDTPHKDAFSVPYARVETFTVDYTEKRLRLKQRGGRTWNFTTTAATADPLFVFHRDVDAARPR